MMKRFAIYIAAVAALIGGSIAAAQETKAIPSTKLEAFSAKSGAAIIKGFTTVGQVIGTGGVVKIDARELRDASNTKSREFGIVAEIEESTGRIAREARVYIDLDEIDSLLKGIEFVSRASAGVTTLKEFEVVYRTRGGLEVTSFSHRGETRYAISTRIPQLNVFVTQSALSDLGKAVSDGRAVLESARKGS